MRLSLILPLLLLAGARAQSQSLFDALYHPTATTVVDAVLTLPVDSIAGNSAEEQPATFTFTDTNGKVRMFAADVSTRGKFRRTHCGHPPLRLNFPKKALRAAGLADYDKYKLVADCYSAPDAVDLVLKEYLAYRAYALLIPDAHFRTQLLRLTFRDVAALQPDRVTYAFLIEETDEMAARTGGRELDSALGLPSDRYAPEAEATHAVFQYLVGNTDWSLVQHRNVKVVERPDGSLVPIGYDFDFSGWVGAPYASGISDLGQQSIYQRMYLGSEQSDGTLRNVSQQFRDRRRELQRLVSGFELLPRTERTVIARYIDRFYDRISEVVANTTAPIYRQLREEGPAR